MASKKVMTLSFSQDDADFLQSQREKGLAMSFVIHKALELYKEKEVVEWSKNYLVVF